MRFFFILTFLVFILSNCSENNIFNSKNVSSVSYPYGVPTPVGTARYKTIDMNFKDGISFKVTFNLSGTNIKQIIKEKNLSTKSVFEVTEIKEINFKFFQNNNLSDSFSIPKNEFLEGDKIKVMKPIIINFKNLENGSKYRLDYEVLALDGDKEKVISDPSNESYSFIADKSKKDEQQDISFVKNLKIIKCDITENCIIERENQILKTTGSNKKKYISNSKYLNDGSSLIDETYPDNSEVAINQEFTKTWVLQNTGDVVWENRYLVNIDEETKDDLGYLKPKLKKIPIPKVNVGETVEISVDLTAPKIEGTMRSTWKMFDDKGDFTFPNAQGIYCQVRVIRPL